MRFVSTSISVADHYLVFPFIPDHIQRLQEVDGRGVWMIALTIMRLIFILLRLNLTEEEEAMVDFSDGWLQWWRRRRRTTVGGMGDHREGSIPMAVHVNTVRATMKLAWGNPIGLKFRAIGEKGDNLFTAEFGSSVDMERALAGTLWIVGRYAIILKQIWWEA